MTSYSIGRYSGAVMEMRDGTCMQHVKSKCQVSNMVRGQKQGRHGEAEGEDKVLRPTRMHFLLRRFAPVGI